MAGYLDCNHSFCPFGRSILAISTMGLFSNMEEHILKNIEVILDRWTDINEIQLRAGEMSAQERRTVLAVTEAMAREIKKELKDSVLLPKEPTKDMSDAFWATQVPGVVDMFEWFKAAYLTLSKELKND